MRHKHAHGVCARVSECDRERDRVAQGLTVNCEVNTHSQSQTVSNDGRGRSGGGGGWEG